MPQRPPTVPRYVSAILCAVSLATAGAYAATADKNKPSISLKASPAGGFSPLRVVMTAEIKGGADDFEDFYCPAVEWHWGDDTRSASKGDCEPYQAGKSEIRRRYTIDRIFNSAGEYGVEFRLKQKGKTVGLGKTLVRIRPGLADRCCPPD